MQVVIKIPEEEYNYVKKQVAEGIDNPLKVYIANGTPLLKGHGDLVDKSTYLKEIEDDIVGNYPDLTDWIEDTQAVIPADKE